MWCEGNGDVLRTVSERESTLKQRISWLQACHGIECNDMNLGSSKVSGFLRLGDTGASKRLGVARTSPRLGYGTPSRPALEVAL
jgi:hypothetical protein